MIAVGCVFAYLIGAVASSFAMANNRIDLNPLTFFVAWCPVLHWVVAVKFFRRSVRNGVFREWIDEYKKIWKKKDCK